MYIYIVLLCSHFIPHFYGTIYLHFYNFLHILLLSPRFYIFLHVYNLLHTFTIISTIQVLQFAQHFHNFLHTITICLLTFTICFILFQFSPHFYKKRVQHFYNNNLLNFTILGRENYQNVEKNIKVWCKL